MRFAWTPSGGETGYIAWGGEDQERISVVRAGDGARGRWGEGVAHLEGRLSRSGSRGRGGRRWRWPDSGPWMHLSLEVHLRATHGRRSPFRGNRLRNTFQKIINKSSYSCAQRGENTTGRFPSSAQRPSGRVAKPPAHLPLRFSPTPFAAQAQGTPHRPMQTLPLRSRGPTHPPTPPEIQQSHSP